ncbi:MAG: hypothetical protein MJ089_06765 [Ruminococcus sp.]|nr:hypothetical protein [Ruminococcus sp.]
MGENLVYGLGFIGGFIFTVLVIFIIRKLIKNKKAYSGCEYDERQILARGKAYQISFFYLLFYIIMCALMDIFEIKWAVLCVQMFIGVFSSAIIFVGISLYKDAYFIDKQRKSLFIFMAIFFILGIIEFVFSFLDYSDGESFLTAGMLNLNCNTLISGTFMILISIMCFVKIMIDRKVVDDE